MCLSPVSYTPVSTQTKPAIICAIVLAILLLAGIFVLSAEARPENMGKAGTPSSRFAAMDENKDGKLSREEFAKGLPQIKEEAFVSMDTDKDGFLSEEEWNKAMTGHSNMPPVEGGTMGMPGGMPGSMPGSMQGRMPNSMPPVKASEAITPDAGAKKMPELIMPPKKDMQ